MYAIKDAMIAKEHSEHELDCAIFNMDIRTFGKDYEKYYLRGRDEAGIRFIQSRIHSVDEVRETGDLLLTYVDEKGDLHQEQFDMVVLSVGLEIPEETVELAGKIGVEVNESRFALRLPGPGYSFPGCSRGPRTFPHP
jgi:heterodisulfide reductase subunit A-like polyferredoxin